MKPAIIIWQIGSLLTFIFLTFLDNYRYTAANWLIAIPVNIILGETWPIYWAILRPIFGS